MTKQGRVITVHKTHWIVSLVSGETVAATVRGDFHVSGDYPVVGDYVRASLHEHDEDGRAVIETVETRCSVITRLDQSTQLPQVLVANVDIMFVVMGLDGDFNLRRLERYLALAASQNIQSVVLLNKVDVATDKGAQIQSVVDMVDSVPVHAISVKTGIGLEIIKTYFATSATAVLLGSSGVGKSTITNWLLGSAVQATASVRESDSRGRHTTTTRQLFALPDGGYLIDTPGMRELSLVFDQTNNQAAVIERIDRLAENCRFRTCDHRYSAGCAVLAAVASGELAQETLDTYYKIVAEREWQQDKSGGKGRYQAARLRRAAQTQSAKHRRRLSDR